MINPQDRYDAVMLCSYGGPRKKDDVLPFMRNATNGRGVPDERLLEVSGHYGLFHNISPINARTLELREEIEREIRRRGCDLEVVVGNRNWTPFFHDTLCDLAMRGKTRVLCVFTSAYVCYSGCRQYREDLARAQAQLAEQDLDIQYDKIRPFYTTEGFVKANVDRIVEAYAQMAQRAKKTDTSNVPADTTDDDARAVDSKLASGATVGARAELPRLAFVTHSIPSPMEAHSGPADKSRPSYSQQHLDMCEELAKRVSARLGAEVEWDLSYCSRSGPPQMPWLEPDINDRLEEYTRAGITRVITAPIGFICDHMEVVFDLDTEAKESAEKLGLDYFRADTVGTHPDFVKTMVDLIWERANEPTREGENGRPAIRNSPRSTLQVSGERRCGCDGSGAGKAGDLSASNLVASPVHFGARTRTEPDESDGFEVEARESSGAELQVPDAFSPRWPAWPKENDSLVSSHGEKLPVACEQKR